MYNPDHCVRARYQILANLTTTFTSAAFHSFNSGNALAGAAVFFR
jgi:hypothetical protein